MQLLVSSYAAADRDAQSHATTHMFAAGALLGGGGVAGDMYHFHRLFHHYDVWLPCHDRRPRQ